jgi:hypothetical protein
MSDTTARLALPLLAAAQAQKHVTLNEALMALDSLVHLSVIDRTRSAPPSAPGPGDRHLIAAGASGAWSGRTGQIAVFQDGGWDYFLPKAGWRLWVAQEERLLVHNGAGFEALTLRRTDRLGVSTDADPVNRLSVASEAVLFSHAGAGTQLKLNKAGPGDTAALLFQTGFSARAELGLAGQDDFGLKVSADGANFREALRVERATGRVSLPEGLVDAASGLRPLLFAPCPPAVLWQPSLAAPASPRTYTIASRSGGAITLTQPRVGEFYGDGMRQRARIRIWNISKTPAQPAWVNWNNAAATFNVSDAAQIAGWSAGETLRLGDPDPTGLNTTGMVAIDCGDHLFNALGGAFAQRGVRLEVTVQGVGGAARCDVSGTGAAGAALTAHAPSDGSLATVILDCPTPTPSPASGAHLIYLSEQLLGAATALGAGRMVRLVGLLV